MNSGGIQAAGFHRTHCVGGLRTPARSQDVAGKTASGATAKNGS